MKLEITMRVRIKMEKMTESKDKDREDSQMEKMTK